GLEKPGRYHRGKEPGCCQEKNTLQRNRKKPQPGYALGRDRTSPEQKSAQGQGEKHKGHIDFQKIGTENGNYEKKNKKYTFFPEHCQKEQKEIKCSKKEAENPFILYYILVSGKEAETINSIDQFFYSPCGTEKLPEKIFPEEKKRQQQYSPCCQKEQGIRAVIT